MTLKSKTLFYVPDWVDDPAMTPAAGLWAHDTRYLDAVAILGSGGRATANVIDESPTRAAIRYPDAEVTAELMLDDDGMTWDVEVAGDAADVRLYADFKDMFELRGWTAQSRGQVLPPQVATERTVLSYRARDGHLRTTTIHTGPGLFSELEGDGVTLRVHGPGSYRFRVSTDPVPSSTEAPRSDPATVWTGHEAVDRLLGQGGTDLGVLLTRFPQGTLPAAGVPWYVAPFGRDALIVAWQTLHVDPDGAAATLRALAGLQGTRHDTDTAEEPGRIIHEARYGELARIGEIPHRPYYGSVDSTSLFLLVAAETIGWTGDVGLLEELTPSVDAALRWVELWGDPDRDGLVEYALEPAPERVPPLTARHQAWKDSDDSLHRRDGREPAGPIAPVETQGYTYRALIRLAELAGWRGAPEHERHLRARARRLAKAVNAGFWLEDDGWYAQALDGAKRPVDAIASNAGQLLFTGLVPRDRAARMVERMSCPDLDSGRGIRTLSSGMPMYDPLSYHNGSVWPHDNGIIADGCYRTGHPDMGRRIFDAMVRVGLDSPGMSLAELHGGEVDGDRLVRIPAACRPQAWAAGTLPGLVRSALGMRADLAAGDLVLSPSLPDFLDQVEIEGMTVLGRSVDLRVTRQNGDHRVEARGIPVRVVSP